MMNEENIETCGDCGKPLMDHETASMVFIKIMLEMENPPENLELSAAALREIRSIIREDLELGDDDGLGMLVEGFLDIQQVEEALAVAVGCDELRGQR